jgi:hypothetical protein
LGGLHEIVQGQRAEARGGALQQGATRDVGAMHRQSYVAVRRV